MTVTNLTPKQQLQAVFALLSNRGLWTQGSLARDEDGNDIDNPLDERATCWCAEGALRKVCGLTHDDDTYPVITEAWVALTDASWPVGIIGTNDDKGYEATLAMITKAMELV